MARSLLSVHLSHCTFTHAAGTPVLTNVTLDLGPGWHGVVGPSGAGKTTLLRLLAGELEPTSGRVHVVHDGPVVRCTQDVDDPGADVRALAERWDGAATARRARLDLDVDRLASWGRLSPGERRRWQVAAALDREPDVLLLDEPTNHLDADARRVLVRELARFDGLGLAVSHDRDLLDELTTSTLRVVEAGATSWAGAYTEASGRWLAAEAGAREAHDAARREQARLRGVLGDVRRDRQRVEQQSRAARRHGAATPDAREAGRKMAAAKAEANLASRVGQLRTRVERADEAVADAAPPRRLGGAVRVEPAATGGRDWLLDERLPELSIDDRVLLHDVDVALRPGEHVHVRGPNGSGKTTLLGVLVTRVRARDVSVAVLAQDLDADAIARDRRALARLDRDRRGWVLATVANLGVDPDRLLATAAPSPGEARKLALALVLHAGADLVILDEPSNHLDLPSVERLQEALAAHDGAVLLVTHDTRLAVATTTVTWQLRDRHLAVLRESSAPRASW